MNCSTARDKLGPLFGDPREPSLPEYYDHVDGCESCEAFFRMHAAVIERTRAVTSDVRAPDILRQRIVKELRDAPGEQPAVRPRPFARLAAAAVAVAAAMVLFFATTRDPDPARMFVAAVTDLATAGQTIATADPEPLQQWFAGRVGQDFAIPAIPDANLRGGRIAQVAGARSAVVEYEFDGVQLGYLVVPVTEVVRGVIGNEAMVMLASDGYRVFIWMQDGTARAVVGTLPEAQLEAIAVHCRAMA